MLQDLTQKIYEFNLHSVILLVTGLSTGQEPPDVTCPQSAVTLTLHSPNDTVHLTAANFTRVNVTRKLRLLMPFRDDTLQRRTPCWIIINQFNNTEHIDD